MIAIRDAGPGDVAAIREVFQACYGTEYPYEQFYDLEHLTRLVYSDSHVLLVAEDTRASRVVGTASVVLEMGALSDLVGEFGRLAVHPDARNQGIGGRLMTERLARVRDRLHVGYVEARVATPFSAKIAEAHGFAPVGFLPLKLQMSTRESACLLAQHFGDGLSLRRNHPRVIPEAFALAELALEHCRVARDVIADEDAAPYPTAEGLTLRELASEGYSPLLRIERGRVRHREVFGPLRLHYGLFKLAVRRSHYLLAMDGDRVLGGVGWNEDTTDRTIRVFELIALDDAVARFLLAGLERTIREQGRVCFIEIDVSAHAPAMQRTLLELGFVAVAYVPAMVFSDVERLDILKMVRLLTTPDFPALDLGPRAQSIADIVIAACQRQRLLPRIAHAVSALPVFTSLSDEQTARLAQACSVVGFAAGERVLEEGGRDGRLYVLLTGQVSVHRRGVGPVGVVDAGECLGENSLLTGTPHSASATAVGAVEAAILSHAELTSLVRTRPDIGLVIYRNLAIGLGAKLNRASTARSPAD